MGIIKNIRAKFHNSISGEAMKMVVDRGNGFYAWDGKLYQSDVVRACIRPKSKAIGKAVAKHIRKTVTDGKTKTEVNPQIYMKFLLEEPNEYMTGQVFREKLANQLALNGNAFALITYDSYGIPCGMYPIPAAGAEAIYKNDSLYIKFYFLNGKSSIFPYTQLIHLRDDFINNDIFGEAPGQALTQLMNVVGTIDQGIVNAIKNSGIIRWLLKYMTAVRDEDLQKKADEFAKSFLNVGSGTGVAAIDSKVDATQINPTDYVPNAAQIDRNIDRIYAFFNTNPKIVTSSYSENEWISYYEAQVEPVLTQMSGEYSRKLFTRKARSFGNEIVFESSNLTYASMSTKLQLVTYVDRGIMTPNEVREYFNMAPIDGGDTPLLRKDTGKLTERGEDSEEN